MPAGPPIFRIPGCLKAGHGRPRRSPRAATRQGRRHARVTAETLWLGSRLRPCRPSVRRCRARTRNRERTPPGRVRVGGVSHCSPGLYCCKANARCRSASRSASACHPVKGSTITADQYFELAHVGIEWGGGRRVTYDARMISTGKRVRRQDVISPTFTLVPELLLGTSRIATLKASGKSTRRRGAARVIALHILRCGDVESHLDEDRWPRWLACPGRSRQMSVYASTIVAS